MQCSTGSETGRPDATVVTSCSKDAHMHTAIHDSVAPGEPHAAEQHATQSLVAECEKLVSAINSLWWCGPVNPCLGAG